MLSQISVSLIRRGRRQEVKNMTHRLCRLKSGAARRPPHSHSVGGTRVRSDSVRAGNVVEILLGRSSLPHQAPADATNGPRKYVQSGQAVRIPPMNSPNSKVSVSTNYWRVPWECFFNNRTGTPPNGRGNWFFATSRRLHTEARAHSSYKCNLRD